LAYYISAQIEYQTKTIKKVTANVNQTKLSNLRETIVAVALGKIRKMSFEFNTARM
jgi:hypothetical protein